MKVNRLRKRVAKPKPPRGWKVGRMFSEGNRTVIIYDGAGDWIIEIALYVNERPESPVQITAEKYDQNFKRPARLWNTSWHADYPKLWFRSGKRFQAFPVLENPPRYILQLVEHAKSVWANYV